MSRREEEQPRDESGVVMGDLAATLAAIVSSVSGATGSRGTANSGAILATGIAAAGRAEDGSGGNRSGGLRGLTNALQSLEPLLNRGGGGGLGWLAAINPLFGLLRLFGGRSRAEEAAPVKYERPPRQRFLGGVSEAGGWAPRATDYGAGWQIRGAEAGGPAAGAQVTVNVQAMDSRSFLDHREDIAAAVRQALLESHSLSDVMTER